MVDRRGSWTRAAVSGRATESRRPDVARDDGLELRERRGLEDVVVETGLERTPPILGVAVTGERDQRARPRRLAQAAGERVAVDVGQGDRDERERDRPSVDDRQRRGRVGRDVDDPTARLKEQLHALRQIGVAIDHEQLDGRGWNGHDRFPDPERAKSATPRFACTLADYVAAAQRVQYRRGTSGRTS